MLDRRGYALVVGLLGCGPQVATSSEATSDAGSSGIASSEGAAESSTTTTTGSVDESSSSSGDPFTFDGDETLVELPCGMNGPQLYLEVHPGSHDGECLPPADAQDFVLVVVDPWDGQGGTFAVGPDGPARASIGLDPEAVTGTLALEIESPWLPRIATLDLASPTTQFTGTADLSVCRPATAEDPCG